MSLQDALVEAGQAHVLGYLDALAADPAALERLTGQLAALDLGLLRELHLLTQETPTAATAFEPPELFPARPSAAQAARATQARARAAELLGAGRVGFLLVAGGQASRLGYDAPKGVFPVGPVTGRSLYAVHASRLGRAREQYGARMPWYIMTSPANDAATRAFFEEQAFFGLDPEDVFFFQQEMLPALDEAGRLLFSARDSLFLAPNGHGGSLSGLARSGALADMRRRGVEQISYFQVDNPLVRPTDPLFLGLHDLAGAGMSSKVVQKRDAHEKVGVIGRMDGALGCIEYSDLPDELREARDDQGHLRFGAGNIAVHLLRVEFVERLTDAGLELPWHVARKAIRAVAPDGTEEERPGFKFETFVFDALARSSASVTLEVERAQEFSPVKNRTGQDSPATTRRDLCRLYARWVTAAGLELPPADAEGNHPVEVDPRLAETQDEFLAHGALRPHVDPAGHHYTLAP